MISINIAVVRLYQGNTSLTSGLRDSFLIHDYGFSILKFLHPVQFNNQPRTVSQFFWFVDGALVYLPMVGEGVEVRELPKLPFLIKPDEDNPLVRPDAEDPLFSASISLVNSCLNNDKYTVHSLCILNDWTIMQNVSLSQLVW